MAGMMPPPPVEEPPMGGMMSPPNEVPPGSLPEEVADDIDAKLSEGEYVIPADVVRWHGVKTFEAMRLEAKDGFMNMTSDGRIQGGGEEPLEEELPPMDAEMPVGEEGEMPAFAEGGVVSGYDPDKLTTSVGMMAGKKAIEYGANQLGMTAGSGLVNAGAGALGAWGGQTLGKSLVNGDQEDQSMYGSIGGAAGGIGGGIAAGAAFGSAVGPVGTLAGAFIGALAGSTLLAGEPDNPYGYSGTTVNGSNERGGAYFENGGSGAMNRGKAEPAATLNDAVTGYMGQRAKAEGYIVNPEKYGEMAYTLGYRQDDNKDNKFFYNTSNQAANPDGDQRFADPRQLADYAYQNNIDRGYFVKTGTTADWATVNTNLEDQRANPRGDVMYSGETGTGGGFITNGADTSQNQLKYNRNLAADDAEEARVRRGYYENNQSESNTTGTWHDRTEEEYAKVSMPAAPQNNPWEQSSGN